MNLFGEELYNTAHEFFPALQGPEWYRTAGFREIALIYGVTEESFRKMAILINRIRHQVSDGTPHRTLHDATEVEGRNIESHLHDKIQGILNEHGFDEAGQPENLEVIDFSKNVPTVTDEDLIGLIREGQFGDKFENEMINNPVDYENSSEATLISLDEIVVKKQKDERVKNTQGEISSDKNPPGKEAEPIKKKRAYVNNTLAHVEKEGKSYTINGRSILVVLQAILAFLLSNGLIGTQLLFFVDGHSLYSKIIAFFSWHHKVTVILDWYHLEKKCKELLSMICSGKKIKNSVLLEIRPLLWHGLVDQAIGLLKNLSKEKIKNKKELTHLIHYLEKNCPMIPVYAIRKRLGLRNSSNRVEKANDLAVAGRQKHRGMSWNKAGSIALTSITVLRINDEHQKWLQERDIDFKLAA